MPPGKLRSYVHDEIGPKSGYCLICQKLFLCAGVHEQKHGHMVDTPTAQQWNDKCDQEHAAWQKRAKPKRAVVPRLTEGAAIACPKAQAHSLASPAITDTTKNQNPTILEAENNVKKNLRSIRMSEELNAEQRRIAVDWVTQRYDLHVAWAMTEQGFTVEDFQARLATAREERTELSWEEHLMVSLGAGREGFADWDVRERKAQVQRDEQLAKLMEFDEWDGKDTAGASPGGRKRKIVDCGSPGDAEIADSQPGATGEASTSSAEPPPAESSRPTTAEQPGTTGAQVSRWCQSLQLHVAAQLEGNNSKGYTCRDCQFTCRRDLLIGKLCLKYHVGDSCERQQMMRMVNYVRGADGNHMKSMEWLLDHRHLLPDEMP